MQTDIPTGTDLEAGIMGPESVASESDCDARSIKSETLENIDEDLSLTAKALKVHWEAIAHHERQIVLRKREINKHSPVFLLAPEIISTILAQVARDHPEDRDYYRWIRATHVCHQWREIARHAPRVWSCIHLTSNMACLRAFVARSKAAPLHITTRSHARREPLEFVLGQLHRIQTLQLTLSPEVAIATIPRPFYAPELRHLDLSIIGSSIHSTVPLPFEECHLSKLTYHVLRLVEAFCLPGSCATLMSSITQLSLSNRPSPTSTLDETLEVLAAMPNLKSVRIYDSLPPLFHGSRRIVHLPQLESLTLYDKCRRCTLLLRHLAYPPTATLSIFLSSFLENELAQLSCEIAAKLSELRSLDESIRSLAIAQTGYSLRIRSLRQYRRVGDMEEMSDDQIATLDLTVHNQISGHSLTQIHTPLPLSNVKTLYLQSGTSFHTSWKSLSDAMPNLRELGISAHGSLDRKISQLLCVQSAKDGKPPPPTLFPGLRVLLLSGMMFYGKGFNHDSDRVLHDLCTMLGSRKLARRMVEELVIRRAVNLDAKGLKRIRKVVGKVTWDPNDVEWEEDDDDEELLYEDWDDDDDDES